MTSLMALLFAVVGVFKVGMVSASGLALHFGSGWCRNSGRCACTIQQFVEFAPIKPNTPASRTIINFDTLPIHHD